MSRFCSRSGKTSLSIQLTSVKTLIVETTSLEQRRCQRCIMWLASHVYIRTVVFWNTMFLRPLENISHKPQNVCGLRVTGRQRERTVAASSEMPVITTGQSAECFDSWGSSRTLWGGGKLQKERLLVFTDICKIEVGSCSFFFFVIVLSLFYFVQVRWVSTSTSGCWFVLE